MGTQSRRSKSRSTSPSRSYGQNGIKKAGNFGLVEAEAPWQSGAVREYGSEVIEVVDRDLQLTVTVRPPIPVHGRISVEAGSEVKRRLLEATPSRRSQLQIRPLPANFYVSQVRYNGRVSEEIFLSEPDGPQQELEVVCTAGAGSI